MNGHRFLPSMKGGGAPPEISLKKAVATLVLLAAVWTVSGCSSKAVFGGMIGAGAGGLIDAMDDKPA